MKRRTIHSLAWASTFAASATIMGPMAARAQTVLGIDCSQVAALNFDKQLNLRAGAVRIGCAQESTVMPPAPADGPSAPPLAVDNIDVISGETGFDYPHVTQSGSVIWSSDGSKILVTYNDAAGASSQPLNFSGVSYSTDGAATWTRIRPSPFVNHGTNFGDPVVVYNAKLATWFVVALTSLSSGIGSCGSQSLGLWSSADGIAWLVGTCVHTGGSADDHPSMWVDNTPTSPFYGRMYVSWNDFSAANSTILVSHSDDGNVWSAPVPVYSASFRRGVQLTGGPDGTVFVAAMDEGGGGFRNRQ